jgi:hypothetical protein
MVTLVVIILMPELTGPLILTIGIISVASIIDYTIALWRGRTR